VWAVDLTSAVDIGSPELPDLKGQNIEQVQAWHRHKCLQAKRKQKREGKEADEVRPACWRE
jgi:hypothetical protein